jgi:hypothetical protein
MASDSSAYYLLGYQPEHAPDGKWHDLEVKVARPGVTVHARRSYLSERSDAAAPPAARRAGSPPRSWPAGTAARCRSTPRPTCRGPTARAPRGC